MTKKDPVLWVVVDCFGDPWGNPILGAAFARHYAKNRNSSNSVFAPFRVVKYLPAPKKRKNRQ